MSLHLRIVTPEGLFFEGEVEIINLPLSKGMTGILPHHMPLISMVEIGMASFRQADNERILSVSGGVVYVSEKETLLLADAIEYAEDVDLERAHRAEERARQRLAEKSPDLDIERAELALKRAINRIRIAHDD